MADEILRKSKLYVGGRDYSSRWKSLLVRLGRAQLDATKGQDETEVALPGLKQVAFECEFVQEFGTDLIEDETYDQVVNLTTLPLTVTPPGATSGDIGTRAFVMQITMGHLDNIVGKIGDLLLGAISARGAGRCGRGTILISGGTAITATGALTGYAVGAIPAGSKMLLGLQVLVVSASDTIDIIVESAPAGDFASPTTRATFAQKSAAGTWEWIEVDGAITDTFWRASATVGGAAISINCSLVAAIVPG